MLIAVRLDAGPSERFAAGCFNRAIGSSVPVTIDDIEYGQGRLTTAETAPDGLSAVLTLDIDDLSPLAILATEDASYGCRPGHATRVVPRHRQRPLHSR